MRGCWRHYAGAGIAAAIVVCSSAPAFADATAFLGANTTPSSRMTKGLAFGVGFTILGFEGEYSDTSDDPATAAPSLTTGMFNVLLQTPFPIYRFEPYVTGGVGVYRETLGLHEDTSTGVNLGGGIKFTLAGPLRLRVDYRVFKLGGGALESPAHRIYAGLNLKF
jgi:opacity protein-like surface antigen